MGLAAREHDSLVTQLKQNNTGKMSCQTVDSFEGNEDVERAEEKVD